MGALQAVVGSEDVHLAGNSCWGEVGQVLAALLLLVDLPLMAIVSTVPGLRTAVLQDQSRDQGCDDHDERHSDCDDLVNRQTWSVPIWLCWFDRLPCGGRPGRGDPLGFGRSRGGRPVGLAGAARGGALRWRGGGAAGGQGKVPLVQAVVRARGSPVDEPRHGGGAALLREAFPLQLPPGSQQQAQRVALDRPPPPVQPPPVQVPGPEEVLERGVSAQRVRSPPGQRRGRVPERLRLEAGAGPRRGGRGQAEGRARGEVEGQVGHGQEEPDALSHTGAAGPRRAPTAHNSRFYPHFPTPKSAHSVLAVYSHFLQLTKNKSVSSEIKQKSKGVSSDRS